MLRSIRIDRHIYHLREDALGDFDTLECHKVRRRSVNLQKKQPKGKNDHTVRFESRGGSIVGT